MKNWEHKPSICFCLGDDGSQEVTKSTSSSGPPEYLEPYVTQVADEAQGLYEGAPSEYFPGQTYANQAPETLASYDLTTARATGGSPLIDAGKEELQKTISGGYLGEQNPYMSQMIDQTYQQLRPQFDAQFSSGGAYGSGLHANTMAEQVSRAAVPLQFQSYENERNRMGSALQQAPGYAQQDYLDAAQLGQVGTQREGFAQQGINEDINRFNFGQMEPWDRLNQYSALLGHTNYGGSGTTSTSTGSSGGGLGDLLGLGFLGLGALGGFS